MTSLRLQIVFLIVAACIGFSSFGQFSENFNSNTVTQLEADCWDFDQSSISNSSHINTGTDAPHGHADSYALVIFGTAPAITTPFYYFDGSTDITFTHEHDGYTFFASGRMRVYLVDPLGGETQIYSRNGEFGTRIENLTTTEVGYYRIRWRWWASGVAASLDAELDDFSTTATVAPDVVETGIVCEGETATHIPSTAVTDGAPHNFEYSWSWVGTAGGTITPELDNNRRASVEWTVGPGNYRLQAQETYLGGCVGRKTFIDVTVLEQPDFAVSFDTVCKEQQSTMSFDGLVGTAPFTITYNDGGGSQIYTTTGDAGSILLSADALQVDITDVVDDNGCHADPTLLIAYPIYYHPKPSTGLIYHQ
ncbi:hypothetical protein [Owenweeksia hongkongensis]|uniref:hypothetical protein n=1 Tax=Owenweeksia hongkongensis TaxID=253245 RepID=UPI003A8F236F